MNWAFHHPTALMCLSLSALPPALSLIPHNCTKHVVLPSLRLSPAEVLESLTGRHWLFVGLRLELTEEPMAEPTTQT